MRSVKYIGFSDTFTRVDEHKNRSVFLCCVFELLKYLIYIQEEQRYALSSLQAAKKQKGTQFFSVIKHSLTPVCQTVLTCLLALFFNCREILGSCIIYNNLVAGAVITQIRKSLCKFYQFSRSPCLCLSSTGKLKSSLRHSVVA